MLSQTVAMSWERCRDSGLDPRARPRGEVIAFAQVSQRREALAALRRLALAEMQLLHSQIAGSNFTIALGDAEGIVLDTISDRQFAESEAGRTIIPGSVWREKERGTNALGLAVLERQPVAIYGREHYFSCHGHLSCMAAPILDSRGEVLGLLDASCANEARQQHTHALVRMAASQIENGMIFHERSESFIFAFHPRVEYLDTLSAGLVAVSRDGEVHSLNRPATTLLAGLPVDIGGHFEMLFDASFGTVMDGLLNGGVVRVRPRRQRPFHGVPPDRPQACSAGDQAGLGADPAPCRRTRFRLRGPCPAAPAHGSSGRGGVRTSRRGLDRRRLQRLPWSFAERAAPRRDSRRIPGFEMQRLPHRPQAGPVSHHRLQARQLRLDRTAPGEARVPRTTFFERPWQKV